MSGAPRIHQGESRKEVPVAPPSFRVREVREMERPREYFVKARPVGGGGEKMQQEGGVVGVGVWTRLVEGIFGW